MDFSKYDEWKLSSPEETFICDMCELEKDICEMDEVQELCCIECTETLT